MLAAAWGGGTSNGYTNAGKRYNPSTNSWTAMTTTGAPLARGYHTAVWTGSEMIVWGGIIVSNNTFTNTGGRYNPALDQWTAMRRCRTCRRPGSADSRSALPAGLTGTVTIRVVDTDRTPGHSAVDSVSLDELFVRAAP